MSRPSPRECATRQLALHLAALVALAVLAGNAGLVGSAAAAGAPDCSTVGYSTAGDGSLEVGNVGQLQCIGANHADATDRADALGAGYTLTADLDASATSTWNGGDGFDPIGEDGAAFTGTFDGNGYTITGLTVGVSSAGGNAGLFGAVDSGTVANLGLVDATVSAGDGSDGSDGSDAINPSDGGDGSDGGIAGGVVAVNTGGVVENTYVRGSTITGGSGGDGGAGGDEEHGSGNYAHGGDAGAGGTSGGLVGTNDGGTVRDSFVDETTIAAGDGGAGGDSGQTTWNNWVYDGRDGGDGGAGGGLVGTNDGTITGSYAGQVTMPTPAGGPGGQPNAADGADGPVGSVVGTTGGTDTYSAVYWDSDAGPSVGFGDGTSDAAVQGRTTAQMTGINATVELHDLDFASTWRPGDDDYPALARDSSFADTADAYDALVTGDGSNANPYEVTTVYELQLADRHLDDHFELQHDVDASATGSWYGGDGFDPVGESGNAFTGTFDGQGHAIAGLTIDRGSTGDVGLFGRLAAGAVLRNTTLESPDVTGGSTDVGGLVGKVDGTLTRSSVVGGTVTTAASGEIHLGGVVGSLGAGGTLELTNASVTVDGNGGDEVGGIAGDSAGSVTKVAFTGTVTNGGDRVGGILGDTNDGTTISETYVAGPVSGASTVGWILGRESGSATVEKSYWDPTRTGPGSAVGSGSGDATAIQPADGRGLNATVHMDGLSFYGAWLPRDGGYPELVHVSPYADGAAAYDDLVAGEGTAAAPYQVSDVYELQAIGASPTAHFELASDLDASDTATWHDDGGGASGFDPIGAPSSPFEGAFDGNGHTIAGLFVDRPAASHVGLFGAVFGGAVESVAVENVDLTGNSQVAGVVGYANATSTVANVTASGSVSGDTNVGGVVGFADDDATVRDVYASTDVAGNGNLGGLVGYVQGSVTVSESSATGAVADGTNVGGLVGHVLSGTVEDAYWDVGTTNRADAIGRDDGSSTGLDGFGEVADSSPAPAMVGLDATTNMSGLAFGARWHATGGYPALAWEDTSPRFAVAIADTDAPIVAGETLTVTASASNWGADGTRAVTLTDTGFSDAARDDADVTLAAGQTNDSVALEWQTERSDVGTGTLTVASQHDAATVEVTVRPGGSTGDGGGSGSPDETTPDGEETDEGDGGDRADRTDEATQITREAVAHDETAFVVAASAEDDELRLEVSNDGDRGGQGDSEGGSVDSEGGNLGSDDGPDVTRVEVDSLALSLARDAAREFTLSVREYAVDPGTMTVTSQGPTDDGRAADDRQQDEGDAMDPRGFLDATGATAVGYVAVEHSNPDTDVDAVGFRFRVRTAYLQETGVGPDDVALYRDEASGWSELPTELVGETATHHVFEADSPGLSLFAIGSTRPVFSVTGATTASSSVAVGETVTVDATVQNRGGASGTRSVVLYADGRAVASRSVEIAGRSSESVSLSFAPERTGEFDLAVGEYSAGTLSVGASGPEDAGDDALVVLAVAAAVVLGVSIVVYRRRTGRE